MRTPRIAVCTGTGAADSMDLPIRKPDRVVPFPVQHDPLARAEGDTAGAINAELDALGDHCPDKYKVFVDYVSIKGFADVGAGGACAEYCAYDVQAEAIGLARQDGYCSGSSRANGSAGSRSGRATMRRPITTIGMTTSSAQTGSNRSGPTCESGTASSPKQRSWSQLASTSSNSTAIGELAVFFRGSWGARTAAAISEAAARVLSSAVGHRCA